MRLLTCGSRLEIPSSVMQQFSGIVGGYFWNLWNTPNLQDYSQKYEKSEVWHNFLYGNRHRIPDVSSGCVTIEEWIKQRVSSKKAQCVTHWVLINEFTDSKGNPYPGYEYENIKKWLITANQANPEAKLIIGDFRPYQLQKWQKIKELCDRLLSENIPLHGVGIQVHFKTWNAHNPVFGGNLISPYYLDALPIVIQYFDGILPVHLIEASGWHHYSESPEQLISLWQEVIDIATQNDVETFCPWWLNQSDEPQNDTDKNHKSMPSFEEFKGAGIFDKDWVQILPLL